VLKSAPQEPFYGAGRGPAVGEGLLARAEEVAEEVASAFVGKEGVVGVVYLGALARGYFDEHSDVDIVVFKRRGARLGWPREAEYAYRGFTIDLEVRCYERDLHRAWSFEERWSFLGARVRYDRDGLVRRLLELKVPLRAGERARALAEELRRASWSIGDVGAWLSRGDAASARYAAVTALRHLLRALAALNWIPPPPDKWLVRVALGASLRPPHLRELVDEVLGCTGLPWDAARAREGLESLRDWLAAAADLPNGSMRL